MSGVIVGAVALVLLVLCVLQMSKAYASQAARVDAVIVRMLEEHRTDVTSRESDYNRRTTALAGELDEAHAAHRATLVQYRNQIFAESAAHGAERDKLMAHIESVLDSSRTDRAQLLNALMVAEGQQGAYGALLLADKRDPNLQVRAEAARRGTPLAMDRDAMTDDELLEQELRSGRYRGRGSDAAFESGLTDEEGAVIIPVGAE